MSSSRYGLRPQDILVALKVIALERREGWRQLDIAKETSISAAEVAYSFERLKLHHFMDDGKRSIKRAALLEFLVHGLKYVFPGKLGSPARGMPTATAHSLGSEIRVSKDQLIVWPDPEGTVRGLSIAPLYKAVPYSAKQDDGLYRLLSLVEVLRVGSVREKLLAEKALEKSLLKEGK